MRIWSIFPFYSQPTGLLDVRTNNYIITSHFLTRFFPPPTANLPLLFNLQRLPLTFPSVTHPLLSFTLSLPLFLSFLVVLRLFLFPSLSIHFYLPPDPHKSVEISYDPPFHNASPFLQRFISFFLFLLSFYSFFCIFVSISIIELLYLYFFCLTSISPPAL